MRASFKIALLPLAFGFAILPTRADPATVLNVVPNCAGGKECRVEVTFGEGREKKVVVTTIRANRVGPDMKYFKGEERGSFEFPEAGLIYSDRPIVVDEDGTTREPSPGDPRQEILTFTMNVSVDPHGHVSFFHGFVHGGNSPIVQGSYHWGYPPTIVQYSDVAAGPRSPVVPREPPPTRVLKGGVQIRFKINCNSDNACRVEVIMTRGNRQATALTFFPANLLDKDMRYFPCEKEGGADLLTYGAIYPVDLRVVVDESGALRPPKPGDAPVDIETLTSTIALDDMGHVTFFYGFIRDPGSPYVQRFYIWGYPPETVMVDR